MKRVRYIIGLLLLFVFFACSAYIIHYFYETHKNQELMVQLKAKVTLSDDEQQLTDNTAENEINEVDTNNTASNRTSTVQKSNKIDRNISWDTDSYIDSNKASNTGSNAKKYTDLSTDKKIEIKTKASSKERYKDTNKKEILEKYKLLHEDNKDLVGWLTIDNTTIDYPVMQSEGNNEYYLNHNFEKDTDHHGSIFLDKACDIKQEATNVIIYGHNMKDGTMFHDLRKYKDESFYKTNKIIHFDTIYESADYEIISVFLSKVYKKDENVFKYYEFFKADNEVEYNNFINNIKKLSLYTIDTSASFNDPLLTLSTCDYSSKDGRLAIVAKKIK